MRLRYALATLFVVIGGLLTTMCSWYLFGRESCVQHDQLCSITAVTLGAVPATLFVLYLGLLDILFGVMLFRDTAQKYRFLLGALLLVPCSIVDFVFNIMGLVAHDEGAIAFAQKSGLNQYYNLPFDVLAFGLGVVLGVWHFATKKKER